jgi:6-phosphogluconolactonase
MNIQVFPDLEAVSSKAAEMFSSFSRTFIFSKGRFAVAISGGSTPVRLYTLLCSALYRSKIDWHNIHFFWADERCVPKDHEESNFKLAFDTLLSKVSVPRRNIHRIPCEEDPDIAAMDYEKDIIGFFGRSGLPVFDLVILGVGEDGHTASLFPGSRSLEEKIRLVVPVYMEKPLSHRITLTLPVFNNASQILFLAAGTSKANAVSSILNNRESKERYPAGLIDPVKGKITWLIDKKASGKLKVTKK